MLRLAINISFCLTLLSSCGSQQRYQKTNIEVSKKKNSYFITIKCSRRTRNLARNCIAGESKELVYYLYRNLFGPYSASTKVDTYDDYVDKVLEEIGRDFASISSLKIKNSENGVSCTTTKSLDSLLQAIKKTRIIEKQKKNIIHTLIKNLDKWTKDKGIQVTD